MEGGEGWPMQRCFGGEQDKSLVMNQTMLRFRPIAPKPVMAGAGVSMGTHNSVLTGRRKKRKYVRVRKNKEEQSTKDHGKDPELVVTTTLQLLPEKGGINSSTDSGSCCGLDRTVSGNEGDNNNNNNNNNNNLLVEEDRGLGVGLPMWLSSYMGGGVAGGSDPTVEMQQMRGVRVESWVTVEFVTGTCISVEGATFGHGRSSDAERVRNLEGDTCPGFISDGMNRVQWLNEAFKRMVSQQNHWSEIAVWLVMKEQLPYTYSAFTCQVKLQYTVGKKKYSRMVPCDLWRMDGGGIAWRLDVKAALTLGR